MHLLVIVQKKKNYNIFINILKGRCEDNIKIDVKELGWDGMDWIGPAQADKCLAFVKTVKTVLKLHVT
jgi:hypothetical protein